jgi:hypothetical protein
MKYIREFFEYSNVYQFDGGAMIVKNADLMKFRDCSGGMVGGFSTFIRSGDSGRFRKADDLYFDTSDGKMKSFRDIPKEEIDNGINQDIKKMFNQDE